MAESDRKLPAFFCPACGQKHRADPAPLLKRGDQGGQVTCRHCGALLKVTLEGGAPVAEVLEPPKKAGTSPAPQAPEPPTGGPYETAAARPLAEGDTAGRYTVQGVLQRGLTSTVYRAHDPTTKRAVALKVLKFDADEVARHHFLRQVDTQANIRHQNIMPVYDRGALDDGRPYFTMELLHFPASLMDLIERHARGTLGEDRHFAALADLRAIVERVFLPVAEGVYVANIENGVVHGDLRPDNVLIDGHSLRPYLTDFGLSNDLQEGQARTTVPLSPYTSPEQARGWVYPRTDVWGLGALLHACITGAPPLGGQGDVLRQHALAGRYAPLPDDVSPSLAAIVRKAMATDPDVRYVNARQMAADVKSWLKGTRVRAVEEFGAPGASTEEGRRTRATVLKTAGWVAAGLAVGLLVGSRFRLGGENPGDVRIGAVTAEIDALDQGITEVQPAAEALPPTEAAALWADLDARAEALRARLGKAPRSGARASVEARLEYVRARFAPVRFAIQAPEGLTIEATNRTSGRLHTLEPPEGALPPGDYVMRVGRATWSARVPLTVRKAGESGAADAPCIRWVLPVDPSALPAGRVPVMGCRVDLDGPPWRPRVETVTVPTFAIDLLPVTRDAYASFLNRLPQDERASRAPAVGFESAGGIWRPVSGTEREAVVGVSPADAAAYGAWRSEEEGAEIRLPTAAEWRLATGIRFSDAADGDLSPPPGPNPFGLHGLDAQRHEIVTAGEDAGALAAPGEGDAAARVGAWAPIAASARDEEVTFRCVQVLPTE